MAPFIFGERNRIHIINLEKTQPMYSEAAQFIRGVIADGGKIPFAGTNGTARESIQKEAERALQPYVNQRWLGGMLTNFKTIRQSIKRLSEIRELATSGALEKRGKKEATQLRREMDKLERSLGGIQSMESLPDALFVVDVGHEIIAIHEAKKIGRASCREKEQASWSEREDRMRVDLSAGVHPCALPSSEIRELATWGALEKRVKKEATQLRREMDKLERSLGGIQSMESLPDALFVVDVGHEIIAIHEAK